MQSVPQKGRGCSDFPPSATFTSEFPFCHKQKVPGGVFLFSIIGDEISGIKVALGDYPTPAASNSTINKTKKQLFL